MNEKEVAEIRRCFNPEKTNITHIRGCYVNEKKEIISQFNQSISLMPQEEGEKMLGILKKTVSGTLNKNLIDISFSTQQVVESEEHKLLMELKNSDLYEEECIQAFFEKAISSLYIEGNYMILLAQNRYDVAYRSKDGEKQSDASEEVFSFILCSICPVKMTKPALSYYVNDNAFRSSVSDWIVSAPELGFMFPAFDDRCSNIYNALYYNRDASENHQAFVAAVFKTEIPMPAQEQKETFQAILQETLGEQCSYDVVNAVHGRLCNMIDEHKINKEIEPLVINKSMVKNVLSSSGISEESVIAFDEKYDNHFGADTEISPKNIVDNKQFKLKMPSVSINVDPEHTSLVETRIIEGIKYILIRVDDDVELNGVNVHINKPIVVDEEN